MKICIVGPSGSGKTTLANIISRMTNIKVVSGDRYVAREGIDYSSLATELSASSYIFEHISGISLLETIRQVPSLVVYIIPEGTDLFLVNEYKKSKELLKG